MEAIVQVPHDNPGDSVILGERPHIVGTMPRVLIDGFFFDRAYGFGRYVRELCHALNTSATGVEIVLLVPHPAEALARSVAPKSKS